MNLKNAVGCIYITACYRCMFVQLRNYTVERREGGEGGREGEEERRTEEKEGKKEGEL